MSHDELELPSKDPIYNSKTDQSQICSAWSVACSNGSIEIFCKFSKVGCDLNKKFLFLNPDENVGKSTESIKKSEDLNLLNNSNSTYCGEIIDAPTPVMVASMNQNLAVFRKLLEEKCEINASVVDTFGNNILHHIAKIKDIEIGKEMLKALENFKYFSESIILSPNHVGDTPIHIAVNGKKTEFVQLLIEAYSKNKSSIVNFQNTLNGHTPLHLAVKRRCAELVDILLSCGADPCMKDYSTEQNTPLSLSRKLTGKNMERIKESLNEYSHMRKSNDAIIDNDNVVIPFQSPSVNDSIVADTKCNINSIVEGDNDNVSFLLPSPTSTEIVKEEADLNLSLDDSKNLSASNISQNAIEETLNVLDNENDCSEVETLDCSIENLNNGPVKNSKHEILKTNNNENTIISIDELEKRNTGYKISNVKEDLIANNNNMDTKSNDTKAIHVIKPIPPSTKPPGNRSTRPLRQRQPEKIDDQLMQSPPPKRSTIATFNSKSVRKAERKSGVTTLSRGNIAKSTEELKNEFTSVNPI